jgi:hypothetical protein
VIPDDVRGYRYAPDFAETIERDGRRLSIRTNALGLRERPLSPADQVEQVLALGDSFTVGFGIEQHEAWPAQLEGALAAKPSSADSSRVINGGVSGYSMRQIRLAAEELVPLFQPRLVIVGAYASRYWRIENPYLHFYGYAVSSRMLPRLRVDAEGTLLLSSARPRWRGTEQWLDDWTFVGSRLFRGPLALLRGDESVASKPPPATLTAFFREVDALNELARREGAELVVLLVSHQNEGGDFSGRRKPYSDLLAAHCQRRGIPVFDSVAVFEREEVGGAPVFRLPGDHHWSVRAHAAVGGALADFLVASGLIGP